MDRSKTVKQIEKPRQRHVGQVEDPNKFYQYSPAWRFMHRDTNCWAFTKERINDQFWTEILPKMQDFETQTWNDILVTAKKQNHAIDPSELHKQAQKRLEEKYIEAESIISLRLTGNHRIYGYMSQFIFNVLWYDDDHGDNDR